MLFRWMTHGNIGYWALVETRDLHGNFVSYKYEKPAECGQKLYISEISYTAYKDEQGPYRILFLREDESSTYIRRDIEIDARLGFIQRDRDLLRRIDISFNNDPVRSYLLQYREGVFSKTLLTGIIEFDASGNEFYTHYFDYYNDIETENGIVPYLPEKKWDIADDNLKSPYLNIFLTDISALGGSGSFGGSGGVAATVGLLDGRMSYKSMTAGGNFSYQSTTNEGFLTLVDINGDGLPDKVYKKDNHIYYRPNLLSYPSDIMFGEMIQIQGIGSFSKSKTSGFGGGVEVNPPASFIGYDNSNTDTETYVYFDDFNADGLIDLVNNNAVFFNHLDDSGNPVFTASSDLTPNPLNSNSEIDISVLPDPAEKQAKLESKFPLHDAVRMWQAPYDGILKITAPCTLVEDTSIIAREDTLKDGVKAGIQYNGTELWSIDIDAGDYGVKFPGQVMDSISVSRGDRFYFRVQSRFNGAYDMLSWDPEIDYYLINASDTLPGKEDVNGKIIGHFKASEDFVISGIQTLGMPKKGLVRFYTEFSKPATSDSVAIEIVKTDTLNNSSIIFYRKYDCSQEAIQDSINFDLEVLNNEFIQFRILSSTNVDWSKLKWDNYLEYIRIDDGTPLTGPDGKALLSFTAVPEYSEMYNNTVRNELPAVADTSLMLSSGADTVDNFVHPIKFTPRLIFNAPVVDTVIMALKSGKKILGIKAYHIIGDTITGGDTLIADVQFGDSIWMEYYFSDFHVAERNLCAEVIPGSDTLNPLKASVFSTINPDDVIFGSLYRGWGQFDYRGDSIRKDLPIDESLLKLSDNRNSNVADMDTSDLANVQNPLNEVFNMMIPYSAGSCYMGTDQYVYVSGRHISASRLGEKNVFVPPYNFTASGLNAVTKLSHNKTHSVGAGLSLLSYSHSWGEGNLTLDMMDMNGDMYPDLLSTDNIQYTDARGVLSGQSVNHALGDHFSKSEANGITLGGSFVTAKSDNSGSKAAAKNVKSRSGNNAKTNKNANSAQETSKSSIGLSGGFSINNDETDQTWLDINGDGLPDKVYGNGSVRLNLGYSFAPSETWNFDAICEGVSNDYGAGIGVNIENGSFIAGVSVSKTENHAEKTFMDINSDGLPDMVIGNMVSFNTGAGFAEPLLWEGLGKLDEGESVGQSANMGFTIGIAIPIFFIKICINPSGSVSTGVSHTLTQLTDIDGDGMPDFLSSEKENELYVRSSRIFRTNILRKIENPLGSTIELDYLLTPAVYKHPGGKLALASVKMFDGLSGDGADTTYTTFEYEDGYYSRAERLFYGFGTVRTHFHPGVSDSIIYRTLEQQYNNSSYYTRGLLAQETLKDQYRAKQKGFEAIYSLRNIHSGEVLESYFSQNLAEPAFVSLDETKQSFFQGNDEASLTTRVTYSYDTIGNLTAYTDYSSGNENDRYSVNIEYHKNNGKYLYAIPSKQEIITREGLIRRRETDIDESGNITMVRQYLSGDEYARFDIEYDEYGNSTRITRPANYKGERMWYEFLYDPVVHKYITSVSDAYGYTSVSEYNYKWGLPVSVTDKNNQRIEYTYDDCGRIQTIRGPYELASGQSYTLAFEYYPGAEVPYALTRHYDSIFDSDIETYLFTDGLGRKVQLKKSALLFNGAGAEDSPGFIVSGKLKYDAFGRINESYYPVFEAASDPASYNPAQDNTQPSLATYDVFDRITRISLPDGSLSSHDYTIGDYSGESVFIDSLTNAINNIIVTYTKANGRKAAIVRKTVSGDISTGFEYNGIGELIGVTDPSGNVTGSKYNMLGQKISIDHPDAGLTEFIYDGAGNTIRKITANLREQIPEGGAIRYNYDYERLTEIVYPRNIQNRVNYSYGEPGESFNRAGRISLVQDASGGQEFFYSKLGMIEKSIRTIQVGESDMRTWIWSAEYDTWNRIQTMIYPDGEKVSYSYNRAGKLIKMHGEKQGRPYSYIARIGYNKFEKQVYLKYGNGTETIYTYDPHRPRLADINVTSENTMLINSMYVYDALSNIISINGSTELQGDIGGACSQSYSYDELNRIIMATGDFTGNGTSSNYSLGIQYDNLGRILYKSQSHSLNSEELGATTYDFSYKYEGAKPGAASAIGNKLFHYDANGNQTAWQDTVSNDFRQLAWDEENRLMLISDNGYLNRYVYDASDTRVIKSHGGAQGVYINGAPVGIINHSDKNYTVYVSPYFVFRDNRFTKHYYNGDERILSKIGIGQFQNQYRLGVFEITAGGVNYISRQQQITDSKEEYEKSLGVAPGPPTLKGIYADPLFSGTAYPDPGTPTLAAPAGWPHIPVFAPGGGPPGAPIQWGDAITNETVSPGFGFVGTGNFEEVLRYFYHSNHNGSVNCVTNAAGTPVQYIEYMPSGDIFVEQHSDWDSPNKFNAKELDGETGLYYFDTRYYDPGTSLWINADIEADKHHGISPYTFYRNNPVSVFSWKNRSAVSDIMELEEFLNSNNKAIIHNGEQVGPNWYSGKSYGSPGSLIAADPSDSFDPMASYSNDSAPDGFIIKQFTKEASWVQKKGKWVKKTRLIDSKKVAKDKAPKVKSKVPSARWIKENGSWKKETFKQELLRTVKAREERLAGARAGQPAAVKSSQGPRKKRSQSKN